MQQVELGLIVLITLAVLSLTAYRFRAKVRERPLVFGAMLGFVPGILGAVVVLVPRTDLVPDDAEPGIWIGIALVATGIVLASLSVGLARR
jgi:hypothetical protein